MNMINIAIGTASAKSLLVKSALTYSILAIVYMYMACVSMVMGKWRARDAGHLQNFKCRSGDLAANGLDEGQDDDSEQSDFCLLWPLDHGGDKIKIGHVLETKTGSSELIEGRCIRPCS